MTELTEGSKWSQQWEITQPMVTVHMSRAVLSTPAMIGLIEGTCHGAVESNLDAAQTTVGTHINVSHLAPASLGEVVTVSCELIAARGRRLEFEVDVRVGDRVLSQGFHTRAIMSDLP